MNEDELRAAFARHEAEAPDMEQLNTTINREAARRRKRRGTLLAGSAAAAVALLVGIPVYLTGPARPVGQNTAASSHRATARKDLNLLLLGSDHRGSWAEGEARSDTIVIVHIPADRRKIYLISVNRDERVAIPGHGVDKINSAFFFGVQRKGGAQGGLELVEETLTQLSGITFDGGAVLEYAALRGITDTLGGVPVCLPGKVDIYLAPNARPSKQLPAGCQTLHGADALSLVRQRYGLPYGGLDRDRNAQRFLLGVAQKASELKLPEDAATILKLSRTDGLTIDLPDISALDLAGQLSNVKAVDVVALSLTAAFHGDRQGETIPAEGLALLKAVKEGSIDAAIMAHPDLVLTR